MPALHTGQRLDINPLGTEGLLQLVTKSNTVHITHLTCVWLQQHWKSVQLQKLFCFACKQIWFRRTEVSQGQQVAGSGGSKEGSRWGPSLRRAPGSPRSPGSTRDPCIQPCPRVPEELVVALQLPEMPLPPLLRAPPGAKQGLAGIFPLA